MNETINQLQTQSKKAYTVTRPQEVDTIAEEQLFAWGRHLSDIESPALTPAENNFAYDMLMELRRPKGLNADDTLPVIIGAQPGFGKSTSIKIYLRDMVRRFTDTFGCIVVMEHLEEIKELADFINHESNDEHGLLYTSRYAYYIQGNQEYESREAYDAQFTTQSKYNVVIMTTRQFEFQVLKKNIAEFRQFKNQQGKSTDRASLLIDEKPSLTVSRELSDSQLNALLGDIRVALAGKGSRHKTIYRKLLNYVNSLREQMEDPDIEGVQRIAPVDTMYILPKELIRQFAGIHPVDKLADLRAFEDIISKGGLMFEYKGVAKVAQVIKMEYEWAHSRSFIFDGTAKVDPEYLGGYFNLMLPKNTDDMSNVTFNICYDTNLSKSTIKDSKNAWDNICKEIDRIKGLHDGQILIVTYKVCLPELEIRLENEINSGKLVLHHFDSGRGSNIHQDIDTAIYVGNLFKGSPYYPLVTQSVVGDKLGKTLSSTFKVGRNGLKYDDNLVEEYKKLDMAIQIVQKTNRLRPNKKTKPVNFYMFNQDEEIINHITSHYKNCKVKAFRPVIPIVGKRETLDEVIEFFEGMESGSKVTQKKLYSEILKVHRNTLTEALKKDVLIQVMLDNGIYREGNSFKKD